jgi:hypothetical protein
MAKAATSPDLQAAFEKHHEEIEGHVERLEQVFELLGKPARGKKCGAIEGVFDEGKDAGARRRPAGSGAGGRAIRNLALWHAEVLDRKARLGRRGQTARPTLY